MGKQDVIHTHTHTHTHTHLHIYYSHMCISTYKHIYAYVYVYIYITALIKEWNLAICNNMDRAKEYNANWNKSVRERQIAYDHTNMWNLLNKTNKPRAGGEGKDQTRKLTLNYGE